MTNKNSLFRFVLGLLLATGSSHCQPSGETSPQGMDNNANPPDSMDMPETGEVEVVPQVGWSFIRLPASRGEPSTIWGSAPDDVWIGSSSGDLIHFDGRAWKSVQSPTRLCIRGLSGSGRRDVWAISNDSCIPYPASTAQASGLNASKTSEILHWDGQSWTRVLSQRGELTAIAASEQKDAWAVGVDEGSQSILLRWDGQVWQPFPYALEHAPTALWATAPNDVWMVGSMSLSGPYTERVQHFDGTSWKGMPVDYGYWGCGVWASGPDNAWVTECLGGIKHWDGTTWKGTQSGELPPRPIWGSGPADLWSFSGTWPVHSDGTRWTMESDVLHVVDGVGIWGSGPGDIWFLGRYGVFRRYKP